MPGAALPRARVPVLLPVALDQTYDYLLPAGMEVAAGQFVLVPFGPQTRIGVVWDGPVGEAGGKPVPDKKLKSITEPLDVPALPASSLRFAEWVAQVHAVAARHGGAHDDGLVGRVRAGAAALRRAPGGRGGDAAARDAGAQARARDRRRRAGARQERAGGGSRLHVRRGRWPDRGRRAGGGGDPRTAHAAARSRPTRVEFGEHQHAAAHAMRAAVDARAFSVTLLDGVTGSGKTEVYFEAVARTLEKGRQALIMLPEIALTSQFMDRFTRRFGCAAGGMAFGAVLAGARRGPGARPRPGRRASWSARARRCSCPTPTSA